jgi:hypothetical protein
VIYVSTALYALGKELGTQDADLEFRQQVVTPTEDSLPAARAVSRLRHLEDLVLQTDTAATSIGRSRARAMFEFRRHPSQPDVWVSIDDDVDASLETLRWLVEAARDTKGAVIAPCWLRRKDPIVNVVLTEAGITRPVGRGGLVSGCQAGGFGLVALHREAVEAVHEARPELYFVDDDGERKLGCFVEVVEGGKWWTEDLAFFLKWLPKAVRRDILLTGQTTHDGKLLELERVPQLPRVGYAELSVVG